MERLNAEETVQKNAKLFEIIRKLACGYKKTFRVKEK
jgi:hypothetical protein